ncbi:DUF459 domain-containing protein [Campylobacter canadensis]|uniref:DUF459 domain-containing protein n=1 Tax=Campylobacter canadensis TaxID=449520 RepID=A0ABS7WR02_9BACT|nr:DUF459 domain-containing protein [Campylobacter canadensis]MBZ7986737.1 DUF459 domain-containing protein [Campylobacter canadensis]MBZ7994574.1 DUF459 domain-containing protein [Campylobacter canadensis]MBZ7996866.1 DUF459 domain-containing protein [Campylobacter canadensis]MBZ7997774.1 DUF459 domain-containing protein [Campylobacter canadensis]MBZ7999905.1 DUF459 domain-containing protein [Campylobacter canadensis]
MKEFVFISLIVFIFFISLYNQSLSEYYEQKYHKSLELNSLYFKKFDEFKNFLENNFKKDDEILAQKEEKQIKFKKCYLHDFKFNFNFSTNKNDKIILLKNDGLVLIGDSLMQGVGDKICKIAKSMQINCVNIAKQSTGLLRKKYYDYANNLEKILKQNNFKTIIVLAGINDLWDIKINKKTLKFGENDWNEFYTNRIKELIKIAKNYQAKIFWYELPIFKDEDKNQKVQTLNNIFTKLANEKELNLVKINSILKLHFDYYLKIDGKSKKLRSNDGVHFTPSGYELLAQDFFDLVEFE